MMLYAHAFLPLQLIFLCYQGRHRSDTCLSWTCAFPVQPCNVSSRNVVNIHIKAVREASLKRADPNSEFLTDLHGPDEPTNAGLPAQQQRQLGKSLLKQRVAAAGLFEFCQQRLLYSAKRFMPITSDPAVNLELQLRKRVENERKKTSLVMHDA